MYHICGYGMLPFFAAIALLQGVPCSVVPTADLQDGKADEPEAIMMIVL